MEAWPIYQGCEEPHDGIEALPDPPPWRAFKNEAEMQQVELEVSEAQKAAYRRRFGRAIYQASPREINLVNTALYLRRPLLVTGRPGTGKSSLAHAVAYELKLGSVLVWPITSRSTVRDALYQYDAVGRLQAAQFQPKEKKTAPPIGEFVRLGPLGSALLPRDVPRVLLIDEIDKSDIDLPNDLLNLLEEGEYIVPELARHPDAAKGIGVTAADDSSTTIYNGRVRCHAFPFIVITSNGERELPAPFLRRCIRLDITPPDRDKLTRIVEQYFQQLEPKQEQQSKDLIKDFLERRDNRDRVEGDLATDQLLNAIYLMSQSIQLYGDDEKPDQLVNDVFRYLSEGS